MPNSLSENAICRVAANAFALALIYLAQPHVHADPISIDWVTVGDPGNANDTTGYGAVNDEYRIAKHEVTIQQYTDFLNAVAASDSNGLYFPNMESDPSVAGIARTGSSGAFTYAVIGPSGLTPAGAASPGNRPVTYVDWFDAARFANWMSNGQPTGLQGPTTTENGAYDLSLWFLGIAPAANGTNPNTGAAPLYRIPTENEWYKAAYYKGGGPTAGYWSYATQSDSAPGNVIGGAANQANYAPGGVYAVPQSASFASDQNLLTDVGAFSGSPSAYGTFDQTGNVFEWNDLDGTGGFLRGLRGGNFASDTATISAAFGRGDLDPLEPVGGFRLVSPVPEPSTVVMVAGGLAWAALGAWRRRARDGARVRAGASLRPCFGLREARLDAEPSPVQPTLGVGCDGPSENGQDARVSRIKRKGPVVGETTGPVAAIEVWVFGGGNSR